MICYNCPLTVHEVAEKLEIQKPSVMRFSLKIWACIVLLSAESLSTAQSRRKLLKNIVTSDETWVYGYEVEQKPSLHNGSQQCHPDPKKPQKVWFNVEVMMTVLFDCEGVVHHEFLPHDQMVNKDYLKAVRRKRSDLWREKNGCSNMTR